MAGKVTGVTHPADLADGATITETWVDNVTNSIVGLDGQLAKTEPVSVDTTKTDVNNTVSETDLFSYTVPANTLGTGNAIKLDGRFYAYNNTGVQRNFTFKLYYGSTSVTLGSALPMGATTTRMVNIRGSVAANGATGAQILEGARYTSNNYPGLGEDQSVAEDSTTALVFKVTITMDAASADIGVKQVWTSAELIDVS